MFPHILWEEKMNPTESSSTVVIAFLAKRLATLASQKAGISTDMTTSRENIR
jgi:hypothetical protein